MPLLRVDSKGKPHILRAQLDGNTATELKLYARFAGDTTTDAVIKAALLHVFEQDKEFLEWKKNPDNLKEPERSRRNRNHNKSAPPVTGQHHETAKTAIR